MKINREYYSIEEAAATIDCKVSDLLHLAVQQKLDICLLLAQQTIVVNYAYFDYEMESNYTELESLINEPDFTDTFVPFFSGLVTLTTALLTSIEADPSNITDKRFLLTDFDDFIIYPAEIEDLINDCKPSETCEFLFTLKTPLAFCISNLFVTAESIAAIKNQDTTDEIEAEEMIEGSDSDEEIKDYGRREVQLALISVAALALEYDRLKIPVGGKEKIKEICLTASAKFMTNSGFYHAWKAGVKQGLFKHINSEKHAAKNRQNKKPT